MLNPAARHLLPTDLELLRSERDDFIADHVAGITEVSIWNAGPVPTSGEGFPGISFDDLPF